MQDGRVVAPPARAAGRAGPQEDAWRSFTRAETAEDFGSAWLAILSVQIGGVSDGVVLLRQHGQDALAPAAFHPARPSDRTLFALVIERALVEGRGVILPRMAPAGTGQEEQPVAYQLALPVQVDGVVCAAVGVQIAPRSDPEVRAAMRELQWGSGWMETWLRRQQRPGAPGEEGGAQRVQFALELVATLLEHPRLADGGPAFVTELAARLGCDRVAIGLRRGGNRCRLEAMSHSSQVAPKANLTRAIEQAMDEAVDQKLAVGCPAGPEDAGAPVVRLAHQQLLQDSGGGAVLTLPLVQDDAIIGALTLERPAGHAFDPAMLDLCHAVASVAGPLFGLRVAAERHLPAHAAASALHLRDELLGPRHAGWKLGGIALLLVAVFFTFVNGGYRVTAESVVEGEVQRALSAPINGFIKEAAYRAGDSVNKGVVIARLDDRDLRVERAKLLSQSEQYSNQYREASATRERAQALMASAQLAQARAQLSLVEEQIARTEMVAPFDAVIVTGDLSQKIGAPVERGQSLFELAPLSSFRVALHVDEHDFADVEPGQHGTLTVNSMPGVSFRFQVTKVTAVNEARDGRNTFRVEGRLVGDYGRLRPGMKGAGKVEIGERKLVWIWTHSLVDRIRLWLWQWLP